MENKSEIKKSAYLDFFLNADIEYTYLLDEEQAKMVWQRQVQSNAASYFKLEDDHWLVRAKIENRIEWITSYNESDFLHICCLLEALVEWHKQDTVYFLISQSLVLETKWLELTTYWNLFLTVEDDCPIVINPKFSNEALLFTSIGEVYKLVDSI